MRRSMILCVCIALCGAWSARAERISITNVSGDIGSGTLQYERSAVAEDSGLDAISIYLVAAPHPSVIGWSLGDLEGTWTTSTGGISVSPGYTDPGEEEGGETVYVWQHTTAATDAQAHAYANNGGIFASYVNLVVCNDNPWEGPPREEVPTWALWDNTYYGTTTHGELYSSLKGAWQGWLTPGIDALLATLYVTSGADVTFTGMGGPYETGSQTRDGWAFQGMGMPIQLAGGFSTAPVPEPATLALAGMGLIGLLCYAWRNRR